MSCPLYVPEGGSGWHGYLKPRPQQPLRKGTRIRYLPSVCMRCRKQLAANLWRRADQEGARTQIERRNFGIADDVYAAGLLLAYMAFMPFCAPGSIDAPSLQR